MTADKIPSDVIGPFNNLNHAILGTMIECLRNQPHSNPANHPASVGLALMQIECIEDETAINVNIDLEIEVFGLNGSNTDLFINKASEKAESGKYSAVASIVPDADSKTEDGNYPVLKVSIAYSKFAGVCRANVNPEANEFEIFYVSESSEFAAFAESLFNKQPEQPEQST